MHVTCRQSLTTHSHAVTLCRNDSILQSLVRVLLHLASHWYLMHKLMISLVIVVCQCLHTPLINSLNIDSLDLEVLEFSLLLFEDPGLEQTAFLLLLLSLVDIGVESVHLVCHLLPSELLDPGLQLSC